MIEYSQKEIDLKFANAVDYMGAFMPNLINFYALFTKRVNNKIKSLRICVKTDITPVFEYNEKWICEIEPHAFNMFLVIELYRFISHHCTRGKEFVGENAFIASTALCNAKELSKFIMGAPQEILDLFAKDVPNKKIVEEYLHQKISNNDWYFENVYDLLTQNQQQQQQEQDQQNQQSQSQQGDGEEDQEDQEEQQEQSGSQGKNEDQQDQQDQNGQGGKDQDQDKDEDQKPQGGAPDGDEDEDDSDEDSDSENPFNGNGKKDKDEKKDKDDKPQNSQGSPSGDESEEDGESDGEGEGQPQNGQSGEGNGKPQQSDSQPQSQDQNMKDWSESGDENTEEWGENDTVDQLVRDVLENKCKPENWGDLSGDQIEEIMLQNKRKAKIGPIINGFSKSIRCRKKIGTRMKLNKRYGLAFMGHRYNRKSKVLFAIDSSGSMSEEDIRKGCEILHNFLKTTEIWVTFWDAEMIEPFEYKKNIKKLEAPGRGGTNPKCIGDYMDEHKLDFDGVVLFTDCIWSWQKKNIDSEIFVISSEEKYHLPSFCKRHISFDNLVQGAAA